MYETTTQPQDIPNNIVAISIEEARSMIESENMDVINDAGINSIVASLFANTSSNALIIISASKIYLVAYNVINAPNSTYITQNISIPSNNTNHDSISATYRFYTTTVKSSQASYIVFTEFNIANGAFLSLPGNVSSLVYDLS